MANNTNDDWKARELGACWKAESKGGTAYYQGEIVVNGEKIRIVGFPVKDKKSESQPDLRIYKDKPKQQ